MQSTILFDLDGTLLPVSQDTFVKVYFSALGEKLAKQGFEAEQALAAVWKGTKEMVKNDGTVLNRERFWSAFAESVGISAERVAVIERITDDFYAQEFDRLREPLGVQADRGELIRSLQKKGYELVLATNPIFPMVAVKTRLAWRGLRTEDFSLITTYESSRFCKPNLDYYREILEKIGKTPTECLMVGNNGKEDACAGELGMEVYLVTDYPEDTDQALLARFAHGSFAGFEAFAQALPDLQG